MQTSKRAEPVQAPKGPRIEERTVEETVEQMNNPPPPEPTQAEADALASGETHEAREARETQERDMQPAAAGAGYKTR